MRRFAWLFALVLLLAGQLRADQPKVYVGGFNIEWLGVPGNRSGIAKNVPQQAEDIASYIRASEVRILALEEVCDDDGDGSKATNTTLDKVCKVLNSGGQAKWTYRLFPKRMQADLNQHTGIAWNEALVKPLGEPFRIPMNPPPMAAGKPRYWDRWATGMKFSLGASKTDVVVIPLHMKSNVGGARKSTEQRKTEAKQLVEALAALREHFSDKDVILIGDTNVLKGSEPAIEILCDAGFEDMNFSDEATRYEGGAPFDRAFVPDSQPEFEESAFEVFKPEGMSAQQYKKKISDHYLVRITIAVMADDD